jgi:hypothetical protein
MVFAGQTCSISLNPFFKKSAHPTVCSSVDKKNIGKVIWKTDFSLYSPGTDRYCKVAYFFVKLDAL